MPRLGKLRMGFLAVTGVLNWVKWTDLYKTHTEFSQLNDQTRLSLSRWRQYIQYFFPGLRPGRAMENGCDVCVELDNLMQEGSATPERKAELKVLKDSHNKEARVQRRVIQKLVQIFVSGKILHCKSLMPKYFVSLKSTSNYWQTNLTCRTL